MSTFALRTARLLLRPLTPADVPALAALYADPEVVRFLRPMDLAATAAQVDRFSAEWVERGHGPLAVVDPDSGDVLGRSGLHFWPQFDEVEAGWVLRRDVWGRGYATEAGRASLDWGLRELGLPLVTAIIAKGNAASVAVAARLGMSLLREDTIYDIDCNVYVASAADG